MGQSKQQTRLDNRARQKNMNQNFIALDIETAKPFPSGEDWREHRPLEIWPGTPILPKS